MDNFFTDLNPYFFNVFTGKNREINYELLCLINSNIGSNVHNNSSREELVDLISTFFREHPQFKFYNDETGEEDNDTDYKKIARDKIYYFVKTGWLLEEETSDFKSQYMVDENAILLLNSMVSITNGRTKQNELYGYVYQIYNAIKTFSIREAIGITEQIVESSNTLVSMLRGVNVSIKKYLTQLLQNKDLTPAEILEKLLVDYNDKVVIKSLDNLRKKDNPDNYRLYINENLDNIYFKNHDELVNLYIKEKLNGVETLENIVIAEDFFKDSFNTVKDVFNNINELIRILNKNNSKYVSSAKSRCAFLLNDNINLEGIINDTLKNIKDIEDFTLIEDDFFNVYSLGSISEDSLYQPRIKQKEMTDVVIKEEEKLDIEEINQIKNNFFKDNMYSAYKINEYVINSLGDKNKIEASELITESKSEDTIKQFLVLLYSTNKNVSYKVDYDTKLDNFKRYDIEFNNFYIERI